MVAVFLLLCPALAGSAGAQESAGMANRQFVQAMQELSPPINTMLSNAASFKRIKVLEAITDELDRNYTDKKTGHIRLTNEVICIVGQKSVN